jgi:ATP-dependent DNA helicase PIF1
MNSKELHECISSDSIHEIDDMNGLFKSMLTEEVLSRYKSPNVPPHHLFFKVGDICLVMRTLTSRGDQISTNTRVRILSIGERCIRVETFATPKRNICIPRINFVFGLPWGHSFKISRKQFPLRLAYSMTFNKAQGQEFSKVALDVRVPIFSHGFLYVGLSRIRNVEDIIFLIRAVQDYL